MESPALSLAGFSREAMLWAISLTPVLVVVIFCILTELYVAALFAMHVIVMIGLPLMSVSNLWTKYRPFVSFDFVTLPNIAVFGLVAGFGFLCFLPLRCGVSPEAVCLEVSPFADRLLAGVPLVWRIIVGLYFCFVNPVIEEFFWRTFLWRELVLLEGRSTLTAVDSSSYGTLPLKGAAQTSAPQTASLSALRLVALGVAYAAYHVVFFAFRATAAVAVAGAVGLTVLGVVLTKTRETLGFTLAVAVHAGVDAAGAAIVAWSSSN